MDGWTARWHKPCFIGRLRWPISFSNSVLRLIDCFFKQRRKLHWFQGSESALDSSACLINCLMLYWSVNIFISKGTLNRFGTGDSCDLVWPDDINILSPWAVLLRSVSICLHVFGKEESLAMPSMSNLYLISVLASLSAQTIFPSLNHRD